MENTCCDGISLYSYKDITKQDFTELIEKLQKRFNHEFNFSKGRIRFNNIDYKSMKLYFINKSEKWDFTNDILIKENTYLGTFLKSFNDAPPWTNSELMIFIECFYDIGLRICRTPEKKILKMSDNPKYYINLFKNLL